MGIYVIEALEDNSFLSELNLHGNRLDDDFAEKLSYLLEHNEVLYRVDISANPIGPDGARMILNAISELNDTLGDLGDLDDSTYMGVRIREELRQAIKLNNASKDKKKAHFRDTMAHNRKTNMDSNARPAGADQASAIISTAEQAEYPLLKPITFTNIVTDDYLDSLVWNLK